MIYTETNHECDRCGYEPAKEKCYCSECYEETKNSAYEDGYTKGLEDGKVAK